MTALLAALLIATAPVPQCQFEDGNPDGTVCVWVDPDTGNQFPVDSRSYR